MLSEIVTYSQKIDTLKREKRDDAKPKDDGIKTHTPSRRSPSRRSAPSEDIHPAQGRIQSDHPRHRYAGSDG